MSVIVTDEGFRPDDWTGEPQPVTEAGGATALALGPADDPGALRGRLDRIVMIRVSFPSFSDGRGFSIARRLRGMGYRGRLRAAGHVIADQYTMARRAGFDEVEISDDLAARQPEDQWRARSNWRAHDYQSRMKARAATDSTLPDVRQKGAPQPPRSTK